MYLDPPHDGEAGPTTPEVTETEALAAVRTLIRWAGDDPSREGLQDTPSRVTRAFREYCAGYGQDPGNMLARVFEDCGGYDDIIVLKDIPFVSHCEHHLAPISGTVAIAYMPRDRIVGISKLARVVHAYARRLQVQERLTVQIAACIRDHLQPLGVAVIVEAQHGCMTCRGVNTPGVAMVTSKLFGCFVEDRASRRDLLALLGY